ncbi:glycerate kinase [Mycolicibacterium frederiksbergense]|uniref:Glycerate kinase n=1 Tax=Mycolicibacterium frederiksbergense TaxID=117567 RepID=A0A6H0SGC2_9MYCO|nr:glycerate kinase [Mycolicibacterium frederiksbergense]QIV85067.1 glycerate kinase [Mycolicibacterium frederiksbergense]
MKVLIAPDSFKGTASATAVSGALAAGWSAARAGDDIIALPQADGGEGTCAAVAASGDWRWCQTEVDGPDGRPVSARWLLDRDGQRAVIELAEPCGIALLDRLDPWRADTHGLGRLIGAALAAGARSVQIGLGGSASTDGGAGALMALGLKAFDASGQPIDRGAHGLRTVAYVDTDGLAPLPPGGVELLVDTAAPLRGPQGAAAVFGPQKGATPADVEHLEDGLTRWARILNAAGLQADPGTPGAGAAGGAGFGLMAWGAMATSGSQRIAELTDLEAQLATADLVLTGEGRFDGTSWTGKLVGHVLDAAARHGVPAVVVAGQVAARCAVPAVSLTDIAGSAEAAMADPLHWLRAAGSVAAQRQRR